uniref:Uncharacterized protein n=1 Tax=Manihot esculenta TaxID=3983 RepID=A0A199UA64_MANES
MFLISVPLYYSSAHENDCNCDDHYSLYVLNVSHNMSV